MKVCGPLMEKKLRPEGDAGEVTNINAIDDIPFWDFAVMYLRPVAAVHPSNSSPPVSPGRHRTSARAGHCLENSPRLPYHRDAACSASAALHLHIVLADFRILDRQRGIRRGFGKVLALRLLRRAPLDAGHIGAGYADTSPF